MNFNDDFNEAEKQIKKTFKWTAIVALVRTAISLGFIGVVLWLIVKAVA